MPAPVLVVIDIIIGCIFGTVLVCIMYSLRSDLTVYVSRTRTAVRRPRISGWMLTSTVPEVELVVLSQNGPSQVLSSIAVPSRVRG